MPSDRESLIAVARMLEQVETIISTTAPMPENRTARSVELLKAAAAIVNDLAGKPMTH